jgi:hypothetical protein
MPAATGAKDLSEEQLSPNLHDSTAYVLLKNEALGETRACMSQTYTLK